MREFGSAVAIISASHTDVGYLRLGFAYFLPRFAQRLVPSFPNTPLDRA